MIIVRLIGGIGNQMFQYALGRHLALKNNTDLKLDISDFNKYKDREYALEPFNIKAETAAKDEINDLKLYKEKSYAFDSNVLKIQDNHYLVGYWQSYKYFEEIEDIIKNDFTFKNPPDSQNAVILNKIKESNSVSIHIRHGDYLSFKARLFLRKCNSSYYKKGVSYILKYITNPSFYIFSDDPDWCRNSLKLPIPFTIININTSDKAYEDLRLMKSSKHLIMANSSFSWWAAYLSDNSEKIIVAPKEWFGILRKNTVNDLVHPSWNKI